MREWKAYEEEIERLKKGIEGEKQTVRDYYEQKIKDLWEKHEQELILKSKQTSDIADQIWAQLSVENQEKLSVLEKELKERFLWEWNQEVQNLVEKLSEEGY